MQLLSRAVNYESGAAACVSPMHVIFVLITRTRFLFLVCYSVYHKRVLGGGRAGLRCGSKTLLLIFHNIVSDGWQESRVSIDFSQGALLPRMAAKEVFPARGKPYCFIIDRGGPRFLLFIGRVSISAALNSPTGLIISFEEIMELLLRR